MLKRQDYFNSSLLVEMNKRYCLRLKKKVYNALKAYFQYTVQSRQAFKIAFKSLQNKLKVSGWLRWQKFTIYERELSLLETEK